MKHEFYYTSRDSVTKIHAIEWIPDGEVKGILQICHGMVEYIDRYDEFAAFLTRLLHPISQNTDFLLWDMIIWDMENPYRQKLIWDILMNAKAISM